MGTGNRSQRVAVIGAGNWGTALALQFARCGHSVHLWGRNEEHCQWMSAERENQRYLPGHRFPSNLDVHGDFARVVADAELVVWSVPSHALRDLAKRSFQILEQLKNPPLHLLAVKGIESDSLKSMAEVMKDELPESHAEGIAVLGGPSFANEVAENRPTAVVVASRKDDVALAIQRLISGGNLRAYTSQDVVGVELGGALKNVIAVAAGICEGAGYGLNARAGVITRGLAEVNRLASGLGAQMETLAGLAGVGDLILTCTGGLSRNRRVGVELGQGKKLDEILAGMGMVAEGVRNALSVKGLAEREGVEMPITQSVYEVLYENRTVTEVVQRLMQRALKSELG